MKQAILLSVQPKWLKMILNGEKTIEIRKTRPKCELPIDVYIYCTKSKDRFYSNNIGHNTDLLYKTPNGEIIFGDDFELQANGEVGKSTYYNGKVVAKFTLNNVYPVIFDKEYGEYITSKMRYWLYNSSCLTREEIFNYGKGKDLYAWHIDNLEIFDKPKELGEFYNYTKLYAGFDLSKLKKGEIINAVGFKNTCKLTKAPQSWQYVEVVE